MPLFTSGGLGLDLVSSYLGLVILVLVVVLRTRSYLHHWYRVSVTDVYVFNNYFARNGALLFGIKQQQKNIQKLLRLKYILIYLRWVYYN